MDTVRAAKGSLPSTPRSAPAGSLANLGKSACRPIRDPVRTLCLKCESLGGSLLPEDEAKCSLAQILAGHRPPAGQQLLVVLGNEIGVHSPSGKGRVCGQVEQEVNIGVQADNLEKPRIQKSAALLF